MFNNQVTGEQFYCSLKLNDIEINYTNIISLVVREWVFDVLPRLELKLTDDGALLELLPLTDDDVITVEVAADRDDTVNRFNMNFDVVDHQYDMIGENGICIYLTGILSTPNIFENKTRSFKNKDSLQIIQQIASENNLKFVNPHNITTYDSMTWYQSNQQSYEFLKYVKKRINVPDDVGLVFSNTKNELVFTSLNTELNKPSELTAKFDLRKFRGGRDLENKDVDKTIIFSSYSMKNIFGRSNYELGYGVSCSWYDGKDIIKKEYNTKPVKMTDKYFGNSNYDNKMVENITYGIHNNVYDKYFETMARYEYMIKNFFSYSLVINCDSIVPINLCDKINVSFPTRFGKGSSVNMNEVISGEYMVGGIIHQISKKGIYLKQLSLHRNGYNDLFDKSKDSDPTKKVGK